MQRNANRRGTKGMKKDRYGMGVRVPCLQINVLQIRHSNMVASEKECRQKGTKKEEEGAWRCA